MAKYINPVATGQAINQGEAQVFDTTGLMKYSLDRKDKAKAAAQADKEKKEKALLDSLVDVNTSNLWSRDLDMYNGKWNDYKDFIKDNNIALQNPSKNVDLYTQKKRMEQEMLQFVSSSGKAEKIDIEIQKMLLQDKSKELQDVDGLYEKSRTEAGNFNNAMEYITRVPEIVPLATLIGEYKDAEGAGKDANFEVYNESTNSMVTRKGPSRESWQMHMKNNYRDDKKLQMSAQSSFDEAGGAQESGFNTAEELYMDMINQQYDDPYTKVRPMGKGGKGFEFTLGGGGTFNNHVFTPDEITSTGYNSTDIGGTIQKDKRIALSKYGKDIGMFTMDLQGPVYQDGKLTKITGSHEVSFQDVIEKGDGSYTLRLNKGKMSDSEYKNKKTAMEKTVLVGKYEPYAIDDYLTMEKLEKNGKGSDAYHKYIEKENELENSRNKVQVIEVNLDDKTNSSELNSNIRIPDFYESLPKLFHGESGKANKSKKKLNG
jgi:hypothetical protein